MSEFDKFANNYDKNLDELLTATIGSSSDYFTEYKIKEIKTLFAYNHQPKRILDFGCGIGKSSVFLNKYFPTSEIYGIDISEESVEIANNKKLKNCNFSVYHGVDVAFKNNFFDLIFISNVFHHIKHDKHLIILNELRKKLADEGYIIMFEHNTLNPLTLKIVNECEFDNDAKLLNFRYAKKIFKKVGFSNIKQKFILFIPPSLKVLLFLDKYLKWLPLGGQYYVIGRK